MNAWQQLYDRLWSKYGICPYCHAPAGEACVDQRWNGKHPRWCRRAHPERKLPKGGTG